MNAVELYRLDAPEVVVKTYKCTNDVKFIVRHAGKYLDGIVMADDTLLTLVTSDGFILGARRRTEDLARPPLVKRANNDFDNPATRGRKRKVA